MNARRFDSLTVAVTAGAQRASRRMVLRGLAAAAAAAVTPGVARAFDGGALGPAPATTSRGACASGADCGPFEICLNGVCTPRQAVGGENQPVAGETTGATTPSTSPSLPTATEVPGTTAVTPPEATAPAGVGGLIQPGQPLPARIYAGRCGSLGANAAFQLIDVGAEGAAASETQEGALTAIPAEFSTTVVNATLADLLGSAHAIDVRVDDADPATSVACGDIGGPVESGPNGNELAVGLQERGQSSYSGIAWLQEQADRTLVRVFLARGLEEGNAVAAAQPAATVAPETTEAAPTPTAAPAATEEAQAAGTPVPTALSPIGPGTRVVTTIDVNLRSAPVDDPDNVLTILGEGVELEVTGTPENGWVPVTEPSSGETGFVSDQFVRIVS
ncbi:MAG: SH3 domain-containing protein [Thermomicrobiales bacterium]|nr:SH3 domain-containing protein [Thermomicrobiales bacterium]